MLQGFVFGALLCYKSKFKGAQLPGGITMNGRELYDDGNSEVMKIEDEITSTYELPPNWEIG